MLKDSRGLGSSVITQGHYTIAGLSKELQIQSGAMADLQGHSHTYRDGTGGQREAPTLSLSPMGFLKPAHPAHEGPHV